MNSAKLLTGGKRKGSVATPAVLIDVERTMRIAVLRHLRLLCLSYLITLLMRQLI